MVTGPECWNCRTVLVRFTAPHTTAEQVEFRQSRLTPRVVPPSPTRTNQPPLFNSLQAAVRLSAKWTLRVRASSPLTLPPTLSPTLSHFRLPRLINNRKNMDSDADNMRDSGLDSDYTSDMESIMSSEYAHTYGKRRFEQQQPPSPLLSSNKWIITDAQIPWNAQQSLSSPQR